MDELKFFYIVEVLRIARVNGQNFERIVNLSGERAPNLTSVHNIRSLYSLPLHA